MNAPIRTPLRGLVAVARERPFDGRVRVIPFEGDCRLSISDMLASMTGLPDDFADICVVRINGTEIPRAMWSRVYPKHNPFIDVAVTFTLPLRGGGGAGDSGAGHKNIWATVASIAVLLVAAAISGGALGPATGGFLAAGTVAASIAGAAIGIAGALAIAALTPPPTSSTNSTDAAIAASTGTTAQSLPASLTGNVLSPGAAIPRVIGTMRVFPPLACPPLVEVIGDLEYAEAVLVLAGPHALSSVRVNGVDAANIAELDTELQEGLAASPVQSLVPRYGQTATPNLELVGHITQPVTQYILVSQSDPDSSSPQWFDLVARDSSDEIWINLAWPQGLSQSDTPTADVNQAVRLRFRVRGGGAWTNCPEIHFNSNVPAPFQKVIRFKWGAIPAAPNSPPQEKGPCYAFKVVPGQVIAPATSGWTADSYFSAGAGGDLLSLATLPSSNVANTELYQDKVIFYLDPATFPKGIYEIQIMRSMPYNVGATSTFTPSTYTFSSVTSGGRGGIATATIYDFFKYFTNSGSFVTYTDNAKMQARVVVSRLSSVWNSNPIQSGDFATVSVKVHSRALEQVSVLAAAYVRDWDGAAWANLTTTSNPAPHFHDVLAGNLGASPLPVAMINSPELVAWRSACIAHSYTCDAVVEGKSYQDVLNLVASSGYARLRHNENWGVFLDFDRSANAPVQIFTPRNMNGFSWLKAFAKRPSGLRAGYINSARDYVQDEIIVYDDPAHPDGSNLEQISYDGLVTSATVAARAAFDLKQADLRLTFYSGTIDWESLVCVRGDLVGVQHDVLAANAGFARITGVTIVAGNVTALQLEGTVPTASTDAWSATASAWSSYSSAWLSARTGIAIRLKGGGGILTKQITGLSDQVSLVTFSTPFADPGSALLDLDCLCAVGPLGSEYKRLIVYSITPDANLGAKITLVDEAPELFH